MPEKIRCGGRFALSLLAASLIGSASAATAPSATASTPAAANSELDAPLFYQLLIGELELGAGQAGVAYQVLLDAARRTSDEALFRRVINIALQARAGDQALAAAKAWRDSLPGSQEAQQMTIQLLAVMNRPAELVEPLRSMLAATPLAQRPALLASLPRLFQRAAEPKKVYAVLLPILQEAQRQPQTQTVALIVQARLALAAGEHEQALRLTQEITRVAPQAEDAMQLALELMQASAATQPAAEALITARLLAQPDNVDLRLAYGRALARAQRAGDAVREFRTVTLAQPSNASAWFALGTLELELRHAEAADLALREYLQRLPPAPAAPTTEGDATTTAALEARQQAWLMLAQTAELRGDMKGAEAWLLKVDTPQRLMDTQFRRASLLVRQGKIEQARKLIQALPEDRAEDARAKLMAESQLLRDAREWKAALLVLTQANEKFPDDADLIYEQSMMAEKLGQLDEMEVLLKRVIALKPTHHHAYNALGYSLAERNVRLDEARNLIARALSLAPAEPFIVDSMGWVEYRLGNKSEALRLLRQAYAARPDAEIAAHLGELLWVTGALEEARRVWAEGAQRDPKNEALRETIGRLKARL